MPPTPNPYNPLFVVAFKAALIHQGFLVAAVVILLLVTWGGLRLRAVLRPSRPISPAPHEPAGRRLVRIGFGALWLADGLLQMQPAMAAGLPSQVVAPSALGSPSWVRGLVNWGITMWYSHPIQFAASVVWLQAGIGVWLLSAARGRWSRVAGLACAGWGLVVWVFGESFGQILAPGASWLTGAPGSALLYAIAGLLLALPHRAWSGPHLGRTWLAVLGVFLIGMAVLQAWSAPLASFTSVMAQTAQPGPLAGLVNWFTGLDEAHAALINMLVVAFLGLAGLSVAALSLPSLSVPSLTAHRRLLRVAVAALVGFCLLVWVFVQDLGVFGGTGTDPNSMIPMALLAVGGYLALVRVAPTLTPEPAWSGYRVVGSLVSVTAILVGCVPVLTAQGSGTADPILARSVADANPALDYPASAFSLIDQKGHRVTLSDLHGKVVLLAFIDPRCAVSCPPLAPELPAADRLLGAANGRLALVAIVSDPAADQVADTSAYCRRLGLSALPNWMFLTGSADRLRRIWRDYGIAVPEVPAGTPLGQSDIVLVIDARGRVRDRLVDDPVLWTPSGEASFASLLADAVRSSSG